MTSNNKKYQVWRINKVAPHGNSHAIDRSDVWSWSKDIEFDSLDDAEHYVIVMNRRMCSYELGIMGETNLDVIRRRCLTDENWAWCRSYHLIQDEDRMALRQKIMNDLRKNHIIVT